MPGHAIGVDLGGTKTAAGVVTAEGTVVFAETVPTPSREGASAVIAATASLVWSLLRRAAAEGIVVNEMGIGSAGVIDAAAGVVVSATDAISGWEGTPLAAELAERTGLRTTTVNDVHAHALGEAWTGAAAGTSSSLLLAFGTGVGGSFIEGGRPLLGRHWVAGHVGHIASPYAYDGGTPLPCVCGGAGHVEAIASGPSLHQAYLRLGGSSAEDARAVARLAHAGDPLAVRALETAARSAGQAAGGLANVLDPEAVIVTGGLAGAGPAWWEAMEAAFRAELMPPLGDLLLQPAALGGAAAIIGAAGLVLRAQPVPLEANL
jgi:glucokinase